MRPLFTPTGGRRQMRSPRHRRILVIARGHIGDLVQVTPALRALRQHYPDARIAVLVNEYAADVLEGCPYVDEVLAWFAYEERGRAKRLGDTARLFCRLVGRFDTVIGLRYSPRPWPALALAIGARTRVGFNQPRPFGRLLTHDAGRPPPELPNRLRNLLPLRLLGIDAEPGYEPLCWGAAPVRATTEQLLASVGVVPQEHPFAVLQASCNWGCNELRSDKWAAIADCLVIVHGMQAVFVGVDDDDELAKYEEIRALADRPHVSLHGRTTLPQLLEVVARSALVVATDSALTQVALAQGVPSVILFGIEPQLHNGPLASERHLMDVIQHWDGPDLAPDPNPHCRFYKSYCHSQHCRENSSLAQTTADEVMDHIMATLVRNGAGSAERETSSR